MNAVAEPKIEVEISPTLVEMIAQGKCTLFAGPLLSDPPADCLGPPTPAWLAFEMAERMQIQREKYDLPWVSQLYADREGRNALLGWVAARLSDMRYCPSLAHHLIAQLPFSRIIYTAHDRLLRMAHESRKVPATYILGRSNLSYATQRTIIQLYGSAEQPDTLKLTEDERRRVWDASLAADLRTWARSNALLILGYAVNDPELSDFYYQLRPEDPREMPRAYMVGPGVSADYVRYWEQHNVTLYSLNAVAFLELLAKKLNIPLDLSAEQPPVLDAEERRKRDALRARFEYLSHLNVYFETGAELRRGFEPHFVIQMRSGMRDPGSGEDTRSPQAAAERAELESLNKLKDGNIEWSQGNLELAKVYFDEALRHNPQLTDAYLSLFHLLVEKRELDQALQVYQELLRQTPQQAFLPERYEIRKIIGQSDLGVIYAAFDREENRLVSVTILRRAYAVKDEDLAQFAAQMTRLESPRISRFLGFGRHRGRTFMLSEYVEGQSLRHTLIGGKRLPYSDAMRIAGQLAEALEDGHRHGLAHLNLQPYNVLLGPERARLVSYGFSRLTSQARSSEQLSNGDSYDYLSPEQLAGEEGDERSDIYALGTILYEMLTGHTPGVGSFQHPSEVNVDVTEAVDVLIDHARERYPDQRFISAHEMRREIDRIALSSFGRWIGQYVRAGLVWISNLYERMIAGKALLVFLPVLAVLLMLSLIPAVPDGIAFVARLLFPLFLYSVLASFLFDWAVRAIARRRGLGSLITSGRGMGAVAGLVYTLFLIGDLGYQFIYDESPSGILSDFGAMLAVVLFLAALALGVMLVASHLAERWWRHYTIGFYWSFLTLVALILFLTVLGWPCGMIGPVECT